MNMDIPADVAEGRANRGGGVGQEFPGRCYWIFGAGSNFRCSHGALDPATMAPLRENDG